MTPGENQTTADCGGGIEIVRMPAELDLATSEGVAEQGYAAIAWTTPGILEAVKPGRMRGHGGTAEVSGGAA